MPSAADFVPSCHATRWNVTTGKEKGRSAVGVAFDSDASQTVEWVRFSARLRRLSQAGKLDARAAPRPSMPSSCLPSACMHVLIRALLYLYHHQAFGALHQHKVFTLTCTCRGEIVESVVLLCSGHMPVCLGFFLPLSLSLSPFVSFISKHRDSKVIQFSRGKKIKVLHK